MNAPRSLPAHTLTRLLEPDRHRVLHLLCEAHAMALELGRDPWDFALQLPQLLQLGAHDSILRWLVAADLAEHRLELAPTAKGKRRFKPAPSLRLQDASCFTLTPTGFQLAHDLAAAHPLPAAANKSVPHPALNPPHAINPFYDLQTRILWLGQTIIKHFKQPAPNQTLILAAFQEEGWPPHLDDPLPPEPEIDRKKRLHDAIDRLNRNQRKNLLSFHGDGEGRGVRWMVMATVTTEGR